MSTKHEGWGWMLALFLFCRHGWCMVLITGLLDCLRFRPSFLLGKVMGPLFMCIGCGF